MAGDGPLFSGTSVNIFDVQQTNGTRDVEMNAVSGPLVPDLVLRGHTFLFYFWGGHNRVRGFAF